MSYYGIQIIIHEPNHKERYQYTLTVSSDLKTAYKRLEKYAKSFPCAVTVKRLEELGENSFLTMSLYGFPIF